MLGAQPSALSTGTREFRVGTAPQWKWGVESTTVGHEDGGNHGASTEWQRLPQTQASFMVVSSVSPVVAGAMSRSLSMRAVCLPAKLWERSNSASCGPPRFATRRPSSRCVQASQSLSLRAWQQWQRSGGGTESSGQPHGNMHRKGRAELSICLSGARPPTAGCSTERSSRGGQGGSLREGVAARGRGCVAESVD